jgi:UDP-N-acetylglucosamine--dolichyl-phosphate N-acetylglucosaminephosphotransferase
MIDLKLLVPAIVSFLIALFLTPYWIKKAKQIGIEGENMNQLNAEKFPISGGVVFILAFLVGVLMFVAYRVFIVQTSEFIIEIFALLVVTLILAMIGFVDDIFGWRRGGLSVRTRIVLCIIAAIPLVAINAGKSIVSLPFIGAVDFGLLYPLFLVPIAVVATSTTFNMLAGFNGLEAGQGIIILSGLGIVAFITGQSWISVIALIMVMALLGFLVYNFYPGKIIPGDGLTYPVGGMIGILAILGNFEKIALFFFIPFIIEVFLKSRGKLKKWSFGKPRKDGTLDLLYDKIYATTHLAILILKKIGIKSTERNVVLLIWLYELIIVILGFIIFI